MNEPLLRQRSPVEIVDAAFALYRANFAVLAAIALILLGPFAVASALIGGTTGALIDRISGIFTPIVTGASVVVITSVLHGKPVSVRQAFDGVQGRWGTLISVSVIQSLLIVVGLVVLVVPGLLAMVWTFAAPMAVVVEGARSIDTAFTRARRLARGQFWHVMGSLLLGWLVTFVFIVAGGIGIGFVAGWLGVNEATMDFLSSILFILVLPVIATVSGLLYFDLRIRTDAYDVERLIEATGEPAPQSPA